MQLRNFDPADKDGIIALIDSVYREYGDVIFLEDADADLLAIEANYCQPGGAFVVLEQDGKVVGCHAVKPLADAASATATDEAFTTTKVCTFRRLYLAPELRGGEWGEKLMRWAIDWAKDYGYQRVEFWSDTRFVRAHRFFTRLGFERDGRVRHMEDGAEPYDEYFFSMDF